MKLQKEFLSHEKSQLGRLARIVSPLVLAFLVFGFFGLFSSNHAFAKTTSTQSTCGNVVISSLKDIGGYGTVIDFGQLSLVEDTCTNLYHTDYVCHITLPSITLAIVSGQGFTRQHPNIFANYYNQITVACSKVGQIIDTAPHAQDDPNTFCAYANGFLDNFDASLSWTCANGLGSL